MNKKRVMLIVCGIVLTTGMLALAKQAHFGTNRLFVRETSLNNSRVVPAKMVPSLTTAAQKVSADPSAQQATAIPKHVIYGLLFHEITALDKKAAELERQGKDSSFLRNYHRNKAGLNDAQSKALNEIAPDFQSELDKLDQQARAVIDRDRALHPGGKLSKGEALPPPPKQLKHLELKRVSAIQNALGRLQAQFGAAEFQRFDDFQHQDVGNRTKALPHVPHPSVIPPHGSAKPGPSIGPAKESKEK